MQAMALTLCGRSFMAAGLVLTYRVMLATGFGPTAWTTPHQCEEVSLRRGGRWSGWGSHEQLQVRPSAGHHVSNEEGKRKRRVRMMSAVDAGAGGLNNNNDSRMRGGARARAGPGGSQDPNAAAMDGVGGEAETNFYAVLGISVGASPADIKNAYRKLAMQAHPDSNGGCGNRDKFQLLTAAYGVLSDPGKRSTYDQGLAMRSFVGKVKAGKWTNVMLAMASLGAAATSVGVSAGVAAVEPLAKDLARGFEELTGSVEVDPITRKQQQVTRTKLEAERKRKAFQRRAEEFSTEASKLERARDARLKEQKDWNETLAERRRELASAEDVLKDAKSLAEEAAKVATERKAGEQAALEVMRRSKAAREEFLQASTTTQRKVSTAEATVAAAEQRLWEALKTLDAARNALMLTTKEATVLESKRDQVMGEAKSAEGVLEEAREAAVVSTTALSQQQTTLAELQTAYREQIRLEEQAAAKMKELGEAAESIGARALRNRKSAEESKVAAQREAEAIEAAARQESYLAAQAFAEKAKREAAAASAEVEKAQREREEASRLAAEAVARARLAERTAGAAAEAAIKAAAAARQATAEAAAAAAAGENLALENVTGGGGGGMDGGGIEVTFEPMLVSEPMASTADAAVAASAGGEEDILKKPPRNPAEQEQSEQPTIGNSSVVGNHLHA